MLRNISLAIVAVVVVAGARPANAEWFKRIVDDFHYTNNWPCQFTDIEIARVREPFCIMIQNGWRTQNTLSDHHFDPVTNQLTEAGELKLRSILRDTPVDQRSPFVLQGGTPEQTATRVASVQKAAEHWQLPGEPPLIMETSHSPRGTGADYVNEITIRFRSTTPDPRLPEVERDTQ